MTQVGISGNSYGCVQGRNTLFKGRTFSVGFRTNRILSVGLKLVLTKMEMVQFLL